MVLLLLADISCFNHDLIPKGSIVDVANEEAAGEMIALGLAIRSYDPREAGYEAKIAVEQSQEAYWAIQDQIATISEN